jgi:ELWxxDGT repeat protein
VVDLLSLGLRKYNHFAISFPLYLNQNLLTAMKKNLPLIGSMAMSVVRNQSHILYGNTALNVMRKTFIPVIILICIIPLATAQVRLVADLNPGRKDPTTAKPFSQHESDGGRAYFVGESNELWTSDGTTVGTKFIKAFMKINELEVIGDVCYISAQTADKGIELWKSNGTAAGTVQVKDIFPGKGSSAPSYLTNLNGELYFSANNGTHNRELWKSNGTLSGTTLVKDIYPGGIGGMPSELTVAGNKIFFVANTPVPGYELWISDGTSAGTMLVKDINPGVAGSSITDMTESNGWIYFSAQSPMRGRQLWKSNGTESGTSIVKVINSTGSALVSDLIEVDGLVFFRATDGVNGLELFRSDGTPSGTFMLANINLPLAGFSSVNGKLYFVSYVNEFSSEGRNIWVSDGTSAGTIQIPSSPELYVSTIQVFHEINSAAYFFGINRSTSENSFYRIELNGSLSLVRHVPWTDDQKIQLVTTGSLQFFLTDGYYWRTDGTSAGSYRLRTLCCGEGSRPLSLEDAGGTLYFNTTNPEGFWKTQGTAESTILLEPRFATEIEGLNNDMYYRRGDSFGPGSSVWKIDGETGIKTEMSSVGTDPRYLTDAVDRLYFAANTPLDGPKLWVTNGTPQGTHAISTGPSPTYMAALGNKAIFNSSSQVWVSDGTDAGTQLLLNTQGGPQYLAQFNGNLYFYASVGTLGLELWKTDGTPGGTLLVKDIRQNDTEGYELQDLNGGVATNDWFFFAAVDPQGNHGIWKTDGTSAGTTEFIVLEPVPQYLPYLIGPAGSNVFFIRIAGSGSEIWVTDGLTTKKLKTIDQQYDYIHAVKDNVIYFITRGGAFSPERNEEIWRSDGTIEGTYQINFQGRPYLLATSGDYVYVAGRADKEGSELFVIEESASTSSTNDVQIAIQRETAKEEIVSSYPSPFTDTFTLNVSGDQNSNFGLEVLATSGTRLMSDNLPHNVRHQIGTSSWPDGIYVVKVKSGNRMITRKVMKLSR